MAVQALVWLSVALRPSTGDKLRLSTFQLSETTLPHTIKLETLPLEQVETMTNSYLNSVLPGAVIAHRFPIRIRNGQSGIELASRVMLVELDESLSLIQRLSHSMAIRLDNL